MTDVAHHGSGNLPDRRPAPQPSKADNARKTFANIRRRFLAPFDAWERAMQVGEEGRAAMRDRPRYLAPRIVCPQHPTSEHHRETLLAIFDEALKHQPDVASLAELRDEMNDAAGGQPIPAANRMIVAAMVAAFPNVRPHSPEYYLEALIEALDQTGLPPAAVAKTCNEIYLTSTYAPTAAEVLAKAKDVQANLTFGVKQIDRYREIVSWAAEVRRWLETVPLLASDRSNLERAPAPPAVLAYHPSKAEWV